MNTRKKARKNGRTENATPNYEPTFEEIQIRAYETHIQRGGHHGSDLDDWFQAEKELRTSGHDRSR